jgi:hypothetical protein
MEIPFKALCINDADKPADIPLSKWIKKNKLYTVIKVERMLVQGGRIGFYLAEVSLEGCFPYTAYAATRFAIILNNKVIAEIELNELLKEAIEEEKNEEIKIEEQALK